jgi:hypothetical protein
LTANVFDGVLCGILMSLCLLSHRSLLKGDDEPKTLPYAIASVCSMGADVRHQCSPAIPALRHESLEHFAFVINRTPEIMRLSIDPDKHLIQVPTPLRKRPMMKASFPDLRGEHRTEATSPEPYRLVADVDVALEQNILDLPQ